MKKLVTILVLLCIVCLFTVSCSPEGSERLPDVSATVRADEDTENTIDPAFDSGKDAGKESETAEIDVDLSVLSITMIYAEVYNIMTNPNEYLGKTIKITGPYSASYYDETDQYYHYVIIEDATACCSQGLEFVWRGKHVYPDDYPKEQTKIEVTGVFKSYEELGEKYYYLAADKIIIPK